jgi:hypothetical protein
MIRESWFRNLFKSRKPSRAKAARRKLYLSVEPLENRTVPTAGAFLQGTAYVDVNNDHVLDNGDTYLSGATVILYQGTDTSTPLATAITDGNGAYLFQDSISASLTPSDPGVVTSYGKPGLNPGQYTLIETPPAGFVNNGTQVFSQLNPMTAVNASTIQATILDPASYNTAIFNSYNFFFVRDAWDYLGQTFHFTGATVATGSNTVLMSSTSPLVAGESVTVSDGSNTLSSTIDTLTSTSITLADPWTFGPSTSATVDHPDTETAGQFPVVFGSVVTNTASVTNGSPMIGVSDTSPFTLGEKVSVADKQSDPNNSRELDSTIVGIGSGTITLADAWPGNSGSGATILADANNPFLSLCWDLQNFLGDGTNIFAVTPVPGVGTPTNAGEIAYLFNHYGTVDIANGSADSSALAKASVPGPGLPTGTVAEAVGLQVAIWELEYGSVFSDLQELPNIGPNGSRLAAELGDVNAWATFYMNDAAGKSERATFLQVSGGVGGDLGSGSNQGQQGMIATGSGDFGNVPASPPMINTSQQPPTATVGNPIADKATVSGGISPTGTVTFNLYNNPTGTGTPLFTDTESLSGGMATSKTYITTATGTDYWVATYNGDSNNSPVTSGTGDEPVVITPATPTINTSQQPPTATVGNPIADKATVSGGFNPTGTVTFNLYSNPNGTGTPLFTDTEPLSGGMATSKTYIAMAVGTDYWVATYNGDSNNSPVTSGTGDEPAVITPGSPSITTTPSATTPTGGSGQYATIGFWHNKNGQAAIAGFSGSVGNSLASSYPHLFGTPNPYTSAALSGFGTTTLAGLSNSQVASVYLSLWTPSGLQKNTYVQAFAVALGVFAGGGGTGGTFNIGSNGAAFGVANGTSLPVSQILQILDTNFNPTTGLFFGGDSTKTSSANSVVDGINSTETFGGSTTVGSGTKLQDSATLSGGVNPTGTITFYLFAPGVAPNATNSNNVYSDTVTISGDGTYTTSMGTNPGGYMPLATGTYQWVAVYSGDSANKSTTSPFGSEPWTVGQMPPTFFTIPGGTVVLGSGAKLTDSATLADAVNPTGTITFYLFAPGATPNATNSNNVYSDTVTVSGNGTYSTSTGTNPGGYLPTVTGTYQWLALYSGDSNNSSSTDGGFGAEPETVTPGSPAITTTPSTTSMTGSSGQFATIGFWHNKNGQAAIAGFSGSVGSSLAGSYPNLFGTPNPYTSASLSSFGKTSLAGLTNPQVASVYLSLWTPSGLQKNTYVQAFAVAFGLYAGGNAGTFNVGSNGASFGVANNTTLPVTQILQTANSNFNPTTGQFYGGDSTKTSGLNNVLDGINSTDTFGSTTTMTTGTKLQDSATLSGGVNPTGTITFYLFAPGVTPNATNSNNVYSDTVTISGDGTYTTGMGSNPGGYAPTATGTYQWVAVYGGDGNNSSVTSPFGSEPWTVGQQTITFFTVPGGSVAIGSGAKLTDSATLADAVNPTGTITFYLFAPGVTPNATNSNNVYSDTVTVSGNGTYSTATGTNPGGYLPTVAGTYQWIGVYSGDANNAGATDSFGNEPETVTPGASISGIVYCDANLNGVYGSGETLESGATITLTGTLTGGGSVTQTATTNSSGAYQFSNLAPGTYTVKLTSPNAGDTAELSHGSVVIPTSYTATLASGGSSTNNNFPEVDYGSISGTVFLDLNDDGMQDNSGDTPIVGATLTVTGTNYLGNAVSQTATSDGSGHFAVSNLLPSNSTGYTVTETPPTGFVNGVTKPGTVNGQTVGTFTANGTIAQIVLPGCNNAAINYNFGDQGIFHGLTATIGFWHNKNGQALINSFNGSSTSTALGNWLAGQFPNLFGKNAPAFNVNATTGTNLAGQSNSNVAAYFLSLFNVTGQKAYAQVLATALAVYTTTTSLNSGSAGQSLAKGFGFTLSSSGTGAGKFTVPSADWAAFNITSSSGSTLTINQLLQLANKNAKAGILNGGNTTLITETNDVFNGINNAGDITG